MKRKRPRCMQSCLLLLSDISYPFICFWSKLQCGFQYLEKKVCNDSIIWRKLTLPHGYVVLLVRLAIQSLIWGVRSGKKSSRIKFICEGSTSAGGMVFNFTLFAFVGWDFQQGLVFSWGFTIDPLSTNIGAINLRTFKFRSFWAKGYNQSIWSAWTYLWWLPSEYWWTLKDQSNVSTQWYPGGMVRLCIEQGN